jgi:hypothetical protein
LDGFLAYSCLSEVHAHSNYEFFSLVSIAGVSYGYAADAYVFGWLSFLQCGVVHFLTQTIAFDGKRSIFHSWQPSFETA